MSKPLCPHCGRTDYDLIYQCKECKRKFCEWCGMQTAMVEGKLWRIRATPNEFDFVKKKAAEGGMSKAEIDKLAHNAIGYIPKCPYCGSGKVNPEEVKDI